MNYAPTYRAFSLIVIGLCALLAGCNPSDTRPRHVASESTKHERADLAIRLGYTYLRAGNKRLASQNFQRAIDSDPNYAKAHAAMAVFQEKIGDNAKADHHFQRALELRPNDGGTRNNYANFLCRQGHYAAADEQFHAALGDRLYNRPELIYLNAGLCAKQIPDLGKAEIYFRQALATNPRTAYALLQMAQLSFDVGRKQAVMSYLNRYWGLTGKKDAASLWLAVRAQRRLGNKQLAQAYGDQLRKDFPDAPQLQYLDSPTQ